MNEPSQKLDPIIKERESNWGDPVSTHKRIAHVWSAILQTNVTPTQVALCMAGLKIIRADINPKNEDSYVDGRAYLQIANEIEKDLKR